MSAVKNIVILNPDQMRWDYMSPNGHPFINTTHLSRLANMGRNFRNCFVASPMCGPSRTSVLTGRYPCEHGVRNYVGRMHPDHPNILKQLGQSGFHRALFGKDHVLFDDAIGSYYDEGEDICLGNMDDHPDYKRSWSSGVLKKGCQWDLTERLTTAGLDYLERRAADQQRFFMTINFQDPHPYFCCPEPYASLFDPTQFELPPNFRREPVPGEPNRMHLWRTHSRSGEATEEDFRRAMATYCGQIRYVDDQVGRVLDKLDELGLAEDTAILFWSDHGEFIGDFGVTHKLAGFYDCLVRVPAILHIPGEALQKGEYKSLIESMDLFATLLDFAGVPQPQGSRARSLLDPDQPAREDIYSEGGVHVQPLQEPVEGANLRAPHPPTQFGPGAMLRTTEWKLCLHSHDQIELYDMINDPHECRNVAGVPENASRLQSLMERLIRRIMCQGQAPEDMPAPQAIGLNSDGTPIWDRDLTPDLEADGAPPLIQPKPVLRPA